MSRNYEEETMERIARLSQLEFDRQAPDYDESAYSAQARRLHPAVLRLLSDTDPSPLLDVGCGTGLFLKTWLDSRRDRPSAAGVDLSERMIAIARDRLPAGVALTQNDARRLDFPDQAFATVVCIASFHHNPKPLEALAEMNRVLAPGGRLVIADLHFPAPIRVIANAFLPFGNSGDYRIYSRTMLLRLFGRSGFSLSNWEILPGGYSLAIAEKNLEGGMHKKQLHLGGTRTIRNHSCHTRER
jgi:ubiquinone/menaquinone biosynthesis C-methylase UbiE